MDDFGKRSVELHKKFHGKIEVTSKIPLENRDDLSVIYTPGVGQVVLEIARDANLAKDYTLKHNTIAVVTDGSAILGLGNLGAKAAIPVMEGKAVLFKKFGGLDAFPICLDTQDVEEIVSAVKHIAPVFGGINLEDIAAPRCFEIERRLKEELDIPVVHDDQHGTATVVLAGLINAVTLRGGSAKDYRVVISGAGAAGVATANLLLRYGFVDIVLCDRQGAIVSGRADLEGYKKDIAARTNPRAISGDLATVVSDADVVIGVSAPNMLTPGMVSSMRSKPIIFALANPVPEIMPAEAKKGGAFIIATGRSDFGNQVNNALVFPGLFRGALDNNVRQISDSMLVKAAEALAQVVTTPTPEKILPSIFDEGVAAAVARAIQ